MLGVVDVRVRDFPENVDGPFLLVGIKEISLIFNAFEQNQFLRRIGRQDDNGGDVPKGVLGCGEFVDQITGLLLGFTVSGIPIRNRFTLRPPHGNHLDCHLGRRCSAAVGDND